MIYNPIIIDIGNILKHKLKGGTSIPMYRKNIKFIEELLEKSFINLEPNENNLDVYTLYLNEISAKDVITLKEYLDYLHMIEN